MTIPTPEEREALARLAEEATPGPWYVHSDGHLLTSQSHPLATLSAPGHRQMLDAKGRIVAGRDAEFIAASRTAVPALLEALAQETARADAAERARGVVARERDRHSRDVVKERLRADAAERALSDLRGAAGVLAYNVANLRGHYDGNPHLASRSVRQGLAALDAEADRVLALLPSPPAAPDPRPGGTFPGDLDYPSGSLHTNHCLARMRWGDGECECGGKGPEPRPEREGGGR